MSVVDALADAVNALHPRRRVVVALDGPDAAGKTTLARKIQARVQRPVLNVSIDRWHGPAADLVETVGGKPGPSVIHRATEGRSPSFGANQVISKLVEEEPTAPPEATC